jgi:hypothetical protein
MAHCRRPFFELHASTGSPLALEALQRIAVLYAIEATIRGQPPARLVAMKLSVACRFCCSHSSHPTKPARHKETATQPTVRIASHVRSFKGYLPSDPATRNRLRAKGGAKLGYSECPAYAGVKGSAGPGIILHR